MPPLTASVLIPSFHRGPRLRTCLLSLAAQTVSPDEVIVVWQSDDTATRDLAESCRPEINFPLKVLHSPTAGVVPAENTGLDAATGEILLLIDDDAIAPPDWLARHLAFYESDPRCGAVGGPAINFHDGAAQPRRAVEPIGLLTWYGRHVGNMYDHVDAWRSRPPRRVHHLVGYNMSLRRAAIDRFEGGLKSYWQLFEMDACLQVTANGFDVWFDFANVVEHHASSSAYKPGRDQDLDIRIFNFAFNEAFVLSKFSGGWRRPARLAYMILAGATRAPGMLACGYAILKHGRPAHEWMILRKTWRSRLAGWAAGRVARGRYLAARPSAASVESKPVHST
jgi:GT2 family glycosyltransferase